MTLLVNSAELLRIFYGASPLCQQSPNTRKSAASMIWLPLSTFLLNLKNRPSLPSIYFASFGM